MTPPGRVSITVLVDNRAAEGLSCEHGLSLLIDTGDKRVLFDTGQGPALPANAETLGISLETAGALVLSHGHYDHTGGIPAVLQQAPELHVYCHPAATQDRYGIREGPAKAIHLPRASLAALNGLPPARLHRVSRPVTVAPGIGLTGPIPRETSYEDTGGPFFLDPEGRRTDPIEDDMALWLDTPKGLIVCLGCGHAGLINTLNHVRRLSGVSAIRAVIGGFHLLSADQERIERTLAALQTLSPQAVVPCHCTGDEATEAFVETLGTRASPVHAGATYRFS